MAAPTDGTAAQSAGLVGVARQPHCGVCPTRAGPFRAEVSPGAGAGVRDTLPRRAASWSIPSPCGRLPGQREPERVPRELGTSNRLVNVLLPPSPAPIKLYVQNRQQNNLPPRFPPPRGGCWAPLSLHLQVEQKQGQCRHRLQRGQRTPYSERTASAPERQSLAGVTSLVCGPCASPERTQAASRAKGCGRSSGVRPQNPRSSSLVPRSSP